jgi:hypothetical protein
MYIYLFIVMCIVCIIFYYSVDGYDFCFRHIGTLFAKNTSVNSKTNVSKKKSEDSVSSRKRSACSSTSSDEKVSNLEKKPKLNSYKLIVDEEFELKNSEMTKEKRESLTSLCEQRFLLNSIARNNQNRYLSARSKKANGINYPSKTNRVETSISSDEEEESYLINENQYSNLSYSNRFEIQNDLELLNPSDPLDSRMLKMIKSKYAKVFENEDKKNNNMIEEENKNSSSDTSSDTEQEKEEFEYDYILK